MHLDLINIICLSFYWSDFIFLVVFVEWSLTEQKNWWSKYFIQVGFTKEGRLLALDLEIYNNAGNSLDLSLSVLERAMFHSDNVYEIPNIRILGRVCFTNFPSHTAFRGFGGPQGMLIAENWIQKIAVELNKSPEEIRVWYAILLIFHRFTCGL